MELSRFFTVNPTEKNNTMFKHIFYSFIYVSAFFSYKMTGLENVCPADPVLLLFSQDGGSDNWREVEFSSSSLAHFVHIESASHDSYAVSSHFTINLTGPQA